MKLNDILGRMMSKLGLGQTTPQPTLKNDPTLQSRNLPSSAPQSSNTRQYIPPTEQEVALLNTLKQNTIDQLPLTPEARGRAQKVDVGHFQPWELDRGAAGYASPGYVAINQRKLIPGSNQPADIMSHELIHALDNNVASQTDQNSVVDSYGFDQLLKRAQPNTSSEILRHMGGARGLYNMQDQDTRDIESAAYFGSNPDIAAEYFPQYYQPMSKAMNYSPVFPLREVQVNGPISGVRGRTL